MRSINRAESIRTLDETHLRQKSIQPLGSRNLSTGVWQARLFIYHKSASKVWIVQSKVLIILLHSFISPSFEAP